MLRRESQGRGRDAEEVALMWGRGEVKRKRWTCIVLGVILCLSIPGLALADWPLYRNDAANTGRSATAAPSSATLLFSTSDLQVRDGTGVCVADGNAYLFTVPNPGGDPKVKSKLAAVNSFNGTLLWERELEFDGGTWSWANPVYSGGKVFMGCGSGVYCFDGESGAPLWRTALPKVGDLSPIVNHTLLVAEGKVFAGDYNSGILYGLDEDSGEIVWRYDFGEGTSIQGAPAYADGWVIATCSAPFGSSANGKVACVNAADASNVRWVFETKKHGGFDVPGSPAVDVAGGLVYFPDFAYGAGSQSHLYCVGLSDGSLRWKAKIWGTSGAPTLDGKGRVFVSGNDYASGTNYVICFDAASGNKRWEKAGWGAYNASVAVSQDGKVLVGCMAPDFSHNGGIAALRADNGQVIWSTGSNGGGNPTISEGIVYTTGGGKLHAYYDGKLVDWYFAEGYTGEGFEEWLCLANFGARDAYVNITYVFKDQDPLVKMVKVGTQRRLTINVNQVVGPGKEVSIYLQATGEVVAERPMYFQYRGTGGYRWTGGHNAAGMNAPLQKMYFAEGYTGEGFEEWLCLANFGDKMAQATVTYVYPDREPKVVKYSIPARRRVTLNVNHEAGAGTDVSVKVEADRPLVAERPVYFRYRGAWDGGHVVTGIDPDSLD